MRVSGPRTRDRPSTNDNDDYENDDYENDDEKKEESASFRINIHFKERLEQK